MNIFNEQLVLIIDLKNINSSKYCIISKSLFNIACLDYTCAD